MPAFGVHDDAPRRVGILSIVLISKGNDPSLAAAHGPVRFSFERIVPELQFFFDACSEDNCLGGQFAWARPCEKVRVAITNDEILRKSNCLGPGDRQGGFVISKAHEERAGEGRHDKHQVKYRQPQVWMSHFLGPWIAFDRYRIYGVVQTKVYASIECVE